MFTGIVTEKGIVDSYDASSSNVISVVITASEGFVENMELGASVSVEGVCLTVIEIISNSKMKFEIIPETINITSLSDVLNKGKNVNLERSLKVGDEIGGHILSGHICSTAEILERIETGDCIDILLEINSEWMRYVLPKGYIALDGISLTVGSTNTEKCTCWVHLIPETLSRTTISDKSVGNLINVEIDNQTQAIIDTVERIMTTEKGV